MQVKQETERGLRTLAEICGQIGVAVPAGADADQLFSGVAGLQDATSSHCSFLGNPKYLRQAERSHAGLILMPLSVAIKTEALLLRVENPSAAFAKVCALFAPVERPIPSGIHPTAVIDPEAQIASSASVGPLAVIEAGAVIGEGTVIGSHVWIGPDAKVGDRCRLFAGVRIYHGCIIGNEVILHSGVVIGADGFGFDLTGGAAVKIPQIGIVRIDDRVEIGANSCVDRARFGQTWIQEGAKIDNLVQIGHNVVIGKHAIMAGQSGVAGSTRLGEGAIIAAQAGVAGHLHIGEGAILTAQTGTAKDVPPKAVISSASHPLPLQQHLRIEALIHKLPDFQERLKRLEEHADADRPV